MMNIKGVRANLLSEGMKVLFSPLRVRKSYLISKAIRIYSSKRCTLLSILYSIYQ